MKDNSTDIRLTEQQMFLLGRKAGKSHSALSPFRIFEKKYSGLKDMPRMGSEFVGKNGQLLPEIASCVEILSNVQSFGAIAYVGRSFSIDMAIYYSNSSVKEGVQLTNTGDAIRLQRPPVIADVLTTLSLFCGESMFERLDIKIDLPVEEAYLLFALVDIARKKSLHDMLSESGSSPGAVSVEDVRRVMENKDSGMQWLAPYLSECLSLPSLQPETMEKKLSNLAKSGFVRKAGSEWVLTALTQRIAGEMLVLDGHIRIRSAGFGEEQSEGVVTDVRAIQGCSGAVLMWSHDDASISLRGISQAQLIAVAEDSLQPGYKQVIPAKPAKTRVSETAKEEQPSGYCPACGAPVREGADFCVKCGGKL